MTLNCGREREEGKKNKEQQIDNNGKRMCTHFAENPVKKLHHHHFCPIELVTLC